MGIHGTVCKVFIIIILLVIAIHNDLASDLAVDTSMVRDNIRVSAPGDDPKELDRDPGTGSSDRTREIRDYQEDLNAPYNWIDITTGTKVQLDDDDSVLVNMGMNFEFYETVFSSCYIGSNGLLSFTTGYTTWINPDFPTDSYEYVIAPLWDDLDPGPFGGGGDIFYKTLNNPTRFVVSYNNVPHYGNVNGYTFQAVLYASTGVIQYNYHTLGIDDGPTVGLNLGDNVHFNRPFYGQYPATPSSIKFFLTIPPVPDDISVRGGGGDETICYAEHRPYVISANLTTYEGLDDISDFRIKMDYNNTNITLGFNGTFNAFYEKDDPMEHVQLLDTSSYSNDGNSTWQLNFSLIFNFSFPHEEVVDCMVISTGKCGITMYHWFPGLFRVENDLEFQGAAAFSGIYQGALNENDWVRGGENISISGISVSYQNAPSVIPDMVHFDVKVADRTGNAWWHQGNISHDTYVNISAQNDTDMSERFEISIENIPGDGECVSNIIFPVKVDGEAPSAPSKLVCHAHDFKDRENEYTNLTTTFVTWDEVVDPGSGLRGYYISQLNNSGTNNGTFTTKTEAEVPELNEGFVDIYVWCVDNVGNSGDAAISGIFVDLTPPAFTNLTPVDGAWHNHTDVEFSAEIGDIGGSGVDGGKISYSISFTGPDEFETWVPFWHGSSADFITPSVTYDFPEGENNYVKWRAVDMTGNGFVESPPVNIKIDTILVEFDELISNYKDWYDDHLITTRINVSDLGSGVDLKSLEFSISTAEIENFGPWTKIEQKNITNMSEGKFEISVTMRYEEGDNNYIRFRGTDVVGNPMTRTEKYNLKVDTTTAYFGEFTPSEETYSNDRDVECLIMISDDGSGVDGGSVEYSVSTSGPHEVEFGLWKKPINVVIGEPTQVLVIVEFDWGRNNYIRWRVNDVIGTGYNVSAPYMVWVNSEPEAVITSPETVMELWSHEPILLDGANSTDVDGDNLTFFWSSNVSGNGSLGNGSRIWVKLAPGKHRLTLYVADGHEYNVTDEVLLTIQKKKKDADGGIFDLSKSGSSGLLLFIILGAVFILVVLIILFLIIVRKRKKDKKEKEVTPAGLPVSQMPPGQSFPGDPVAGVPNFQAGASQPAVVPPVSPVSTFQMTGGMTPQFALPQASGQMPTVQPGATPGQAAGMGYVLPTFSAEEGKQDLNQLALPPGPAAPAAPMQVPISYPGPPGPPPKRVKKRVVKTASALKEPAGVPETAPEVEIPITPPLPEAVPDTGESEPPAQPEVTEAVPDTVELEPPAQPEVPEKKGIDGIEMPLSGWSLNPVPATPPEPAPAPEEVEESLEEKGQDVQLTCHSCSKDYVATIASFPVVVACPHCGTEGQIDSLG